MPWFVLTVGSRIFSGLFLELQDSNNDGAEWLIAAPKVVATRAPQASRYFYTAVMRD